MALLVTLIVLLILAGVALSAVFSQDGIFHKAELATGKYGEAKARETLEIAFGALQAEKYEERLSVEALDTRITEEINKMGGEEMGDDKTEVIVDGYRFLVDRTVPKIVEELGAADGVVISASVSGNNGWFKAGETINVSVTGIIKTYSGGNITTYSATKGGEPIANFSINPDGSYSINNITTDTTIVINVQDSNGKSNTKKIPIIIKVDNIPPVVDTITAKADGLKMKFSATGHDNESGIKHFNYTITSTEDTTLSGISADQRTGIFTQEQTVEIITTPTGNRNETTYTILVTATDNCENTTLEANRKTETLQLKNIKITLDRTDLAMLQNQEVILKPTISPTNANEELEWSSSNPSVATIDNTGKIVGKSIGKTTITASAAGSDTIKASCVVRVLEGVPVLENGQINEELFGVFEAVGQIPASAKNQCYVRQDGGALSLGAYDAGIPAFRSDEVLTENMLEEYSDVIVDMDLTAGGRLFETYGSITVGFASSKDGYGGWLTGVNMEKKITERTILSFSLSENYVGKYLSFACSKCYRKFLQSMAWKTN